MIDFISDLQAVIDKVKGGLMTIIGDKKGFSYIFEINIFPCRIAAQMISNFALRNDK